MTEAVIERVDVRVLALPVEGGLEADGTATWHDTDMVVVQPACDGVRGLGYTYVAAAAARVIRDLLAPAIAGTSVMAVPAAHLAMLRAVRNHGRPGLVACAISAVDIALWDLKAQLLGLPLAALLGSTRGRVPVYASGGFISESLDALARELAGYVAAGHRRVKIKIGRDLAAERERLRIARAAVGADVELMVDANGAYQRKQALAIAEVLAREDVRYLEEPVSADDLDGLRLVRDHAPAGIAVAAGEYGYDAGYFDRMLGAVDILQADATRALGVTGFLHADALCIARSMPLSSHCAPAIHAHLGAAARQLVHLEYFRDHARMEALVFDGVQTPIAGELAYDPTRPGLGLVLREEEAQRHAA
jgi:L-alanine-DL-glutamate epimerase-like enolase superfamily enzyme